jgi:hypothetical protein
VTVLPITTPPAAQGPVRRRPSGSETVVYNRWPATVAEPPPAATIWVISPRSAEGGVVSHRRIAAYLGAINNVSDRVEARAPLPHVSNDHLFSRRSDLGDGPMPDMKAGPVGIATIKYESDMSPLRQFLGWEVGGTALRSQRVAADPAPVSGAHDAEAPCSTRSHDNSPARCSDLSGAFGGRAARNGIRLYADLYWTVFS